MSQPAGRDDRRDRRDSRGGQRSGDQRARDQRGGHERGGQRGGHERGGGPREGYRNGGGYRGQRGNDPEPRQRNGGWERGQGKDGGRGDRPGGDEHRRRDDRPRRDDRSQGRDRQESGRYGAEGGGPGRSGGDRAGRPRQYDDRPRRDDVPRRDSDRPRRDDRPRWENRRDDRPRRDDRSQGRDRQESGRYGAEGGGPGRSGGDRAGRPRQYDDRPRRDDRPRWENRRDDRPRRDDDRPRRDDRPRWENRRDDRPRRDDRLPRPEREPGRTTVAQQLDEAPSTAPPPALPDDIQPSDLPREIRAELRALPKLAAETVARHLVAAGRTMDDDPDEALAHALAARRLAARVAAVREAVGLAAYQAGQWQTALTELRTYQRISGRQAHLAVVADCERALGRPERAIDIHRNASREGLEPAEAVELLIVAAGARRDLGQRDAAVAMLQVPELTAEQASPSVARLRYAYADTLLDAGRQAEAREWFARAAVADEDTTTDAAERLLELDGVIVEADPEVEDDAELADPEVEDAELAEPPAPTARLVDAYDLVILDLDGVVYRGEEPVPGAAEAIARLQKEGPPVVYATNNASRRADQVVALLGRLGIEATTDEVLTSAAVAAEELARRLAPSAAVLVVGTDGLADEVQQVGLRPVRSADEQPAAVVQGYGPQVGWADLAEAHLAISAGAQWVVTNPDRTLPHPRGTLPGNGALVAALRTSLGREPDLVVGKPQPALLAAAARHAGADAPLVVGDRLDTDIEGAHRAGMDSLLVLTGCADRAQAETATGALRPAYVGADLTALFLPGTPPEPGATATYAA